jgi:glycine/D-amino acid oxidase-like deaminating enzyme/nitrite reductase/ring-hydroxylating ferredoxin subunit
MICVISILSARRGKSENCAMPVAVHPSYWFETAGGMIPRYSPLQSSIEVDVAILGGGITGLTAAAALKQAGQHVAVLEAEEIGAGTTGFTSGHLDATTDFPLAQMVFDFGQSAAGTVTAATRDAIDQIERRCLAWPDCEFRRIPSYQFTESADGLSGLQSQCAAARKLGFNCWFTRQVPLPFACIGAVQISNQGRFHSLRYLHHLAEEIHGGDSAVYENTSGDPPVESADGGCTIETPGGTVTARHVLVATHSPFLGRTQLELRVFAYQSYVIAARIEDAFADALFWDDADPYHYLRPASPHDPQLVLIGGGDHKTGHPGDEREKFAELEEYANERFAIRAVEHQWSAQYFIPADGLPHVGRMPGREHTFVATGYSGTGLTWGTVAGTLVARMMLGQRHPLEEILAPGRLTLLASAKNVIAEGLDAVRRFTVDRFAGSKPIDEDSIAPGTGQVILRHGHQVAVYRDPTGALFRLSPVCTHAGCIVHWNQAEHTWDCPCHGGRYTPDGRRFAGPPVDDLGPARNE